jgi:cytidylate kinase
MPALATAMTRTPPAVITIDGPAGAGKSTLGARLARRLGYLYFDTGVLYRALTWAVLQRGIDLGDADAIAEFARSIRIEVTAPTADDGRQSTVLVEGRDVTWELRGAGVEQHVSKVARYPAVREALRARQRAIGQRGRVVMVGRDIGTVVMPDAQFKIYLLASIDERARRRAADLQASVDDIRADIERRDSLDSHVMAPAADAVVVSTDDHTPDEVVEMILQRMVAP